MLAFANYTLLKPHPEVPQHSPSHCPWYFMKKKSFKLSAVYNLLPMFKDIHIF